MKPNKLLRFGRIEEDEGARLRKKYEESLKQKKEMLKQEFEHLEEIRKFDEVSVKSLNEVRFKAELDKLTIVRRNRESELLQLQNQLQEFTNRNIREVEGIDISKSLHNNSGFRSSVSNNHHSDQLYLKFSKSLLAKKPGDYTQYIEELKAEQERYQYLVECEGEKTKSLETVQTEILKTKVLLQEEIHEIKLLNKTAANRFSNIEAIKFLANEKSTSSKKNLKVIKGDLREIEEMRKNFRKTQVDKQNECKKEIYVGEEYVSHNGMKIEEAELKSKELDKDIKQLEQEEKRILEKRQKSHNILQYIEFFEEFERMFMNPVEEVNSEDERLVDKYYMNDTLINQIMMDNSGVQNSQFDRNQLINVINKFFQKHPDGTVSILNFMLQKYWQLMMDLQQNNYAYETTLILKTKSKSNMDKLDQALAELLQKNYYIKEEEQPNHIKENLTFLDQRDSVAYDAGLFVSTLSKRGEQPSTKITTLNIFRQELDEMNDNNTSAGKILILQNLLFNFMLSLSELLHRSAQTLQIVSENSYNMTSIELDQHVQAIMQFVNLIWSKGGGAKEVDLNLHQIQQMFIEVIMNNTATDHEDYQHLYKVTLEGAQYFYIQSKQDQLIWNLLTPQHFRNFLEEVKKGAAWCLEPPLLEKLNLNLLLPSHHFANLRHQLASVFSENFKALFDHYQKLESKLRDLCFELKIYLKEKDPKFDPKKLGHVVIREGISIKEARENILKKMDLYKTGELSKQMDGNGQNASARTFVITKGGDGIEDQESLNKAHNFQMQGQQEMFTMEDKKRYHEDQLVQIKTFFRSKLTQKFDPSQEAKQKHIEDQKRILSAKENVTDRDDFDVERDEMKDNMLWDWAHRQEDLARAAQLPQEREQFNEKKAVIREVTDRLYGERGNAATTLKSMSMTNGILSDIDRLEKQPSSIEQPKIISNFKNQKKSMYRNLNKELSLPTLHFLKPTRSYFQRRELSQEQLKAMATKKYEMIEKGMGSKRDSRPNTESTQTRKPKSQAATRPPQSREQQAAVEKFYARYGNQEQMQQFLGQLINQRENAEINMKDFPFQFSRNNQGSQDGAKPKSILVQPQQ